MLPQLVTILYCLNLTAFFLSNKNGDLAGFFVLSRKDNLCSSVCGPFSTKSQWQYPFINLIIFYFFFLFALLVLKRLNKMAITIIHISHQGSNCCWLPAKGYAKNRYRKYQQQTTQRRIERTVQAAVKGVLTRILGSLSNYDDDHNNDFKKTIGLMIKTTALHVHHAF